MLELNHIYDYLAENISDICTRGSVMLLKGVEVVLFVLIIFFVG